MDELLGRAWWMLALRGAAGILFGLLAIYWPGLTLLLLVAIFASYATSFDPHRLVDPIAARPVLDRCGRDRGRGAGVTALVLIAVIGVNAIVTGVFDLIAGVRLKRRGRTELLLFFIGILSVLFGIFVLVVPGAGALALVWMIGTYAIVTGALLLALGLVARNWRSAVLRDKQNTPLHS